MFRPCIDIHNGQVKQIVGGSLRDAGDYAEENFVSERSAKDFADMYRKDGLHGGHIILLNGRDSAFYEATRRQAMEALSAFPGGIQVGGGIRDDNAADFLKAGASHVIVTSYLFDNHEFSMERVRKISAVTGREHLVIDLSCKRVNGRFYIVTDRWQTITKTKLSVTLLNQLSAYCDEFLIHGVDVEGKSKGPSKTLITLLSKYHGANAITYAGGIHSLEDIRMIAERSEGRLNYTVGSALDLFGGNIPYDRLLPKA